MEDVSVIMIPLNFRFRELSNFSTRQSKQKFLSDFVFELQHFAVLQKLITIQLVDADNNDEIIFSTAG
jgi:hypothetical protein